MRGLSGRLSERRLRTAGGFPKPAAEREERPACMHATLRRRGPFGLRLTRKRLSVSAGFSEAAVRPAFAVFTPVPARCSVYFGAYALAYRGCGVLSLLAVCDDPIRTDLLPLLNGSILQPAVFCAGNGWGLTFCANCAILRLPNEKEVKGCTAFPANETEYALRVVFWTVPLRPLAGKGHILRAYTADRRLSLGRSAADMGLWDTEKRQAGFSCCLHSFAKGIFLCHGYR